MISMFMILWIERKVYARVNDRRGATTALRSLWVGENGVTAGEWWNMIPYGLGKPVGAINGWLNRVAGNDGHEQEMVNRVGNRIGAQQLRIESAQCQENNYNEDDQR